MNRSILLIAGKWVDCEKTLNSAWAKPKNTALERALSSAKGVAVYNMYDMPATRHPAARAFMLWGQSGLANLDVTISEMTASSGTKSRGRILDM